MIADSISNNYRLQIIPTKWYEMVYALTFISSYVIHFSMSSLTPLVFFIVDFLIVQYLVYKNIKDKEDFNKIVSFATVVFTIYALLAIFEGFTQINVFDILFSREVTLFSGANSFRFGILRGHGVCTVSINHGMLLTFGWTLSSYKLFNENRHKFGWWLCYIAIGTSVLLTLSRAILLASLFIQFLLTVKCGFSQVIKRIILIAIAILGASIIFNDLFFSILKNLGGMVAALIDPRFISRELGIYDVGNRVDLWKWVFADMDGKWLLGHGFERTFSHNVQYLTGNGYWEKSSIEVQWLYVLFQKGLYGLIGFIAYQVGSIFSMLKFKLNIGENRLTFNTVSLVASISYFLVLFSFAGFEDLIFFYILVALNKAYQNICLSQSINNRKLVRRL